MTRRIGGVEVQFHTFSTLALDGGEWASEPFWTWWRKVPSPCQESNPRSAIIQPVAQR